MMTAEQFNNAYPVGTRVRAWPGLRPEGRTIEGTTRSRAWILCGTPVVQVTGHAGGISLDHVEVIP